MKETKNFVKDTVSKSWFCVLNNPEKNLPELDGKTPEQICQALSEMWCGDSETRSGAWLYCISADGLHHIHMVLEDTKAMRFSAVKKIYPTANIQGTKGNKKQVEDYIYKRGDFEEKGEKIVHTVCVGEIKGNQQGRRNDLNKIKEMIFTDEMTPAQIIDTDANLYRLENYINKMYYDKRLHETPFRREVIVYWHFGKTGTGKSYTADKYVEKYGREQIYFTSATSSGGSNPFDGYTAEKYLFIDELRSTSQFFNFDTLLSICQGVTTSLKARYQNKLMLWTEVHITSPLMPYEMFDYMDKHKHDEIAQLYRRISYYVYHYIDENGQYQEYTYDNKNSKNRVDRSYIEFLTNAEKIKKTSEKPASDSEEKTDLEREYPFILDGAIAF